MVRASSKADRAGADDDDFHDRAPANELRASRARPTSAAEMFQVGHQPHPARPEAHAQHAAALQWASRASSLPGTGHVDDHDVGLHRMIDLQVRMVKPCRERPGVCVILGQPLQVVVQGVQAGRGQDPGLAHAAAPHLAEAVGPG